LPNEYLDNVNSEEVRAFSIKYNDRDNNFPKGMNSRQYYSIYPFTVQPLFGLAALTENADWKGQFSLHIFLIFFEILTFIFLRKLIALLSMNPVVIALYWLNPLIIIELVGNLHTEGFAICFILIAIWYLLKEKIPAFVLAIVLAIGAKLTPLLILPALFRSVPFRGFFALSLSVVILSVLSLVFSVGIENLPNFWKSFLLYFETFEFNAGIYYALNDFMFTLTKVNYADKISVLLTIVFISSAIGIGWRKNSDGFIKRFLLIYAAYFLLAQVVNPWYIALLIPIGILSRMLFPLIWGVIVWGSYTAYTPSGVEENHLFVILQFCLILILYTLEQKGKLTKLKRVIYPFASE
jgi:alpha-1,6-mannosyltransferase